MKMTAIILFYNINKCSNKIKYYVLLLIAMERNQP
jgi:hypothetical protein